MRSIVIGVSAFICATLAIYATGAFTAASFDFTKWETAGRLLLAVSWLFMAPAASAIAVVIEKEMKR